MAKGSGTAGPCVPRTGPGRARRMVLALEGKQTSRRRRRSRGRIWTSDVRLQTSDLGLQTSDFRLQTVGGCNKPQLMVVRGGVRSGCGG